MASSAARDRWIGGVSSGIAHRLGVDPLIVRGVFIVLTIFAGVGVLLVRPRVGAAARTRRPDPRPGGRRRPLDHRA